MRKLMILLVLFLAIYSGVKAANRISNVEYVDMWRQVAVKQMIDFKIPASITLAQGILESGSGNSDLAQKGNNHFGIKCHGWQGEKMFLDDDQKDECFRVYQNAELSYVDHSDFLVGKSRYASLFNLDITDYKGWSKGLKEAGYATNPKYPDLLIEIIERLNLSELDNMGLPVASSKLSRKKETESSDVSTFHMVKNHVNKVKYIVAKKGDTFYKISKEYEIGLWQLYRYNDFHSKKEVLEEGDIIYLQPKRKHAKEKGAKVVVSSKTTLRQISQEEAIKLESLLKMNGDVSSADAELQKGFVVRLR
jgi:hypothetical protein